MANVWVLLAHEALQVLIKRFVYPIALIWKEKEWNDFCEELRGRNDADVN